MLLLAERWQRAAWAHNRWAERAKVAVDFFEGRQWTEQQLMEMRRQQRPALTFNIIAPLVRLVLGYNGSNKTDIVHRPGQDARSSEEVATVLSQVEKAIAQMNKLEFVDTEVFLDGLITGRGYYDSRLDFDHNDYGEIAIKAWDPFQVYIDPDAETYDLNQSASFMIAAKMVSIDEIEAAFGKPVAELLRPFTRGQTPLAPIASIAINGEITPVRTFGERNDFDGRYWDDFYALSGDFVDIHRKTIRVMEVQHKVHEERQVVIDLETGDKKVLPRNWGRDKIEKILLYGQMVGNPLIVERRRVTLLQWTTMAGDVLLYDAPSMYDRYTINGFFPYFRRGMTRGMVEDLIDPQKEKNKRHSARVEIMSKLANGGWMYHESALDPVQERNLKRFGSQPGVAIKWKGDRQPQQIEPASPSLGHERLERNADDDLRSISGINESALGELDRVQSGRAIEARQRQAVLSVQMYMDNFKRTKCLLGDTNLSIIQNHYTEPRLYRIMGEDGHFVVTEINKQVSDPGTGAITRVINDVTVGKYISAVDDSPLSATFLNAQFEEMLLLLEKMGPALAPYLPMFADLMIGMSSLPRKDEWIERFKQVLSSIGQANGAAPPAGPAQSAAGAAFDGEDVPHVAGPQGPHLPIPGA